MATASRHRSTRLGGAQRLTDLSWGRYGVGALCGLVVLSMGGYSANPVDDVVDRTSPPSEAQARLGAAQAVMMTAAPVSFPRTASASVTMSEGPAATAAGGEDIPGPAIAAYQRAASVMAETAPACKLPWTLLAGIGRVESDHGRYGGAVLGADGVSRPHILGVALDGTGEVAKIRDTDRGALDGDDVWDRAVGPLQFIPTTWALAGVDGDADGVRDPHDLDDAALAAAVYLCAAEGDLSRSADQRSAVYRYNHSSSYVTLVMAYEQRYRNGLFTLGGVSVTPNTVMAAGERLTPAMPARRVKSDRPDAATTRTGKPADRPAPKPTVQSAPDDEAAEAQAETAGHIEPGPAPVPDPDPAPVPEPEPSDPEGDLPGLATVTGLWTACDEGFCLDATPLLLGDPELLDQPAAADYDADGETETLADELIGLLGRTVTVVVDQQETGWTVFVIDDLDYLVEVPTTS